MLYIRQEFAIKASARRVFDAVSTPFGLDSWWTKTCTGTPSEGAEYALGFGPDYDWHSVVTQCIPDSAFEIRLTKADSDWQDSRVAFELTEKDGSTTVKFQHMGWPEPNEHYWISCLCWTRYLDLLKLYVETGETVPYEKRLDGAL
jgi:uncharacterized protein YndB with AHSA1/START domain